MMKLSAFHYDLPADRIAQEPVTPRDHSRLLTFDRKTNRVAHHRFYEIPELLQTGDVLVVNTTKVFPARLRGTKRTGGAIEVLLLALREGSSWRALVRGTTKAVDLVFPEGLTAQMMDRLENGEWIVRFSSNAVREFLAKHGEMPLPPYIRRGRSEASDVNRYQTVYAQQEGAVAAPTAGFHFTPEVLSALQKKGIEVVEIMLHVGWGTFRPVRTEDVESHAMLAEPYEVSASVAQALTAHRQEGRRIIAVGTTAVRTLETICDEKGNYRGGRGETALYIYPGYSFKSIDALITNFHLPDSTPLLLANAFAGGTPETPFPLKPAYEAAIREGYRFYSYGDAMLIV